MDIQKQAEYLIKKFNLNKDLQKFGEAHLVGSVAMKTMLKHDIDFQVYTKGKPTLKIANKVKEMFLQKGFEFVYVRRMEKIGKIVVSVEYFLKNQRWTIDVALVKKGGNPLYDSTMFLQDCQKKINDKKRKQIVNFKKIFSEKKLLHGSMSYFIYKAVLEENIQSELELLRYLKKNKVD